MNGGRSERSAFWLHANRIEAVTETPALTMYSKHLSAYLISAILTAVTGCYSLERARTEAQQQSTGEPLPTQLPKQYDARNTTNSAKTSSRRTTQIQPKKFDALVQPAQYVDSLDQLNVPLPTPLPLQDTSPTEEGGQGVTVNSALSPRTLGEALGTERVEEVVVPPTTLDIDFSMALATAAGQNPQVQFASARIQESLARWDAARVLWLPSLRAGVSYNKHEGTLQNTSGQIQDVSRSSLNTGLGLGSVGAGSPAVPGIQARFHVADALFQPKIAACGAIADEHAATTVTNDLLLDTSLAYLQLLRSKQEEVIARETLQNAKHLAELTASFADSGQGPQADADRAQTELSIRQNEVSRSEESVKVASARLAELIKVDPTLSIVPQEPTIVPIDLVVDAELGDLISTGLMNRPELAESRSLVCEAIHRFKREKYSTLVPSVILGISSSGFGGGRGGTVGTFRDRFDFLGGVYWEMRNFGLGDHAARHLAAAQLDQAEARQVAVMDRIAREISEAHAQVTSRRQQRANAERAIKAATNSYNRNMERIREGQGLPIEVLQAIDALDQARREYLRTLVDYNEAQFRLHRALGWPIQ